jgi:Clp protease
MSKSLRRAEILRKRFLIFDLLRALPVPVSTRAISKCFSAAIVLLMAGDFRAADIGAEFLFHPSSCQREALPPRVTAAILQESADRLACIDGRQSQMLAIRTGTPRQWFENEQRTEDYLAESDAITSGIVHQFEGLTMAVDPAWPAFVRSIANRRDIYFPSHFLTENYYAACRCAESLYRKNLEPEPAK